MQSRIGLWGGSCAVRLPKMAVETLGFHEGETVSLTIEGDALVLRAAAPAYSLQQLVMQAQAMTTPEALDAAPMGEEAL